MWELTRTFPLSRIVFGISAIPEKVFCIEILRYSLKPNDFVTSDEYELEGSEIENWSRFEIKEIQIKDENDKKEYILGRSSHMVCSNYAWFSQKDVKFPDSYINRDSKIVDDDLPF